MVGRCMFGVHANLPHANQVESFPIKYIQCAFNAVNLAHMCWMCYSHLDEAHWHYTQSTEVIVPDDT